MQKFNNRKQTNKNMRNSRNRGTNDFFLLDWSQKDRLVGDMTTHFFNARCLETEPTYMIMGPSCKHSTGIPTCPNIPF